MKKILLIILASLLITACARQEEELQPFSNAEVIDKFTETGFRGSQQYFIQVDVSDSIINFNVTKALYQAMTVGSRIDGEHNKDFELRIVSINQGES